MDADGRELETHYVVEGDRIVQIVDTQGATFPVVADPQVTGHGAYNLIPVTYFQWNREETERLYTTWANNGMAYFANVVCSVIPGIGNGVCMTMITHSANDLVNNLNAAHTEKKCLKARVPMVSQAAIGYLALDFYRKSC